MKDMIPPGGGLPEFIRSIIEIKYNGKTALDEMKRAAGLWDGLMYGEGIVAVGDVSNYDYTFDVKEKSGIYYHTFVELLDTAGESAQESFGNGLEVVEEARKRGLKATLVPHANYTMCDELMALAGGGLISDEGVRAEGIVSVHFKESVEMGGSEETLQTLGCIRPDRPLLLVHCIYATEEDIDAATDKFKTVTFVPCPCSNSYIENRLPDLDIFRRKGLHIALGTDSLSSNTQLSMVEEIKCIQKHLPHIPLTETVTWATQNGAQALGIDSWAGSFEPGKKPGIVLLTGVDFEKMRLTDAAKGKKIV